MNSGAAAKRPRGRPRGKPFIKNDPRSNKAGSHNAALQSYTINFLNALASKIKPEELADLTVEDVRRHRPGAREFVADRLMGKVTQPVQADQNIVYRIIYDKTQRAKIDGSANS